MPFRDGDPPDGGGSSQGALLANPTRTFVGTATAINASSITLPNVTANVGERLVVIVGTNDPFSGPFSLEGTFGTVVLTERIQAGCNNVPATVGCLVSEVLDEAVTGSVTITITFNVGGPTVAVMAMIVSRWAGTKPGALPFGLGLGGGDPHVQLFVLIPVLNADVYIAGVITSGPPSDSAGILDAPFTAGARVGVTNGVSATIAETYALTTGPGSVSFYLHDLPYRDIVGAGIELNGTQITGTTTYDLQGLNREDIRDAEEDMDPDLRFKAVYRQRRRGTE